MAGHHHAVVDIAVAVAAVARTDYAEKRRLFVGVPSSCQQRYAHT